MTRCKNGGYIHVQSIHYQLAYNFPTPFGDRGGSQSCNFGKSVRIEIGCGRFDLGICSRFLWFRGDFLQKSASECTHIIFYLHFSPPRTITNTSNDLESMQPRLRMFMLHFKLAIDLQTLAEIRITFQQRKTQCREKVGGIFF